MLDLANPRDIKEDVRELNVQLYNLDDLRYIRDKNIEKRVKEAEKAEIIIEAETTLLKDALKQMEITPILSALNVEAEKVRKSELEKTLHMLDVSDNDAKKLEMLTHSIVDKMLFNIIKNLKQAVSNDDDETISAAKKILVEYTNE